MHGIGAQTVDNPRIKRDVARVRSAGRFGDTQLAHLSPEARSTLKRMGGSGTRNPQTGLEEHFKFKDLLPILAPVALNFVAPGVGSAIGTALGFSGAAGNIVGSGLVGAGIGALTGGKRGALTGGLAGGALAGFNELGGFQGIGERLGIGGGGVGGGAAASSGAAPDLLNTQVQPPGLEGVTVPGDLPAPPPPSLGVIAGPASTSASTRGSGGVPAGTTADKPFDWKKAALLGGGALLLSGAGQRQGIEEEEAPTLVGSFGGPLPKYELDRTATDLSDEELRRFGQAGRTTGGTGVFFDAPNRYKFKNFKEGGKVDKGVEKWRPHEAYDKFRKPGSWRGDEVLPNRKPATAPRRAAERLEDMGRNGDTILAHINPEEAALLKAMGGAGSVNPHTGLLEFSDTGVGESFGGGGTETGLAGDGSGGIGSGAETGGYLQGEPQVTPTGGVSMGPVNPGTYNPGFSHTEGTFNLPAMDPPSVVTKGLDWLGQQIQKGFRYAHNNPASALINLASPALLTAGSKLVTGKMPGELVTGIARQLTDYVPGADQEIPNTFDRQAGNVDPRTESGDMYIPGPTRGIGMAQSDVEQMAANAATPANPAGSGSPWTRESTMPTDEELAMFGRGFRGGQQGAFYENANFKDGGEVEFDAEGSGYDYETARRSGLKRDKRGHMGSVVPIEDEAGAYLMLKGKKHPTWAKGVDAENMMGRAVVKRGKRYVAEPFAPGGGYEEGGEVMDGRSDDVPAMLSEGEHVLDAEFVSLMGNGSNEAGHKRIEKMKAEVRKRKGKALAKGKISPDAKMPKVA